MDDRLNRFRQLEKPRDRTAETSERTSTSGRIDAVLGPGEKAPVLPASAPGEETVERARQPAASNEPPLEPEDLASMKGSQAELEAMLLRELDRRPMHAGRQISLWRALMRRSLAQDEDGAARRNKVIVGVSAALASFTFGCFLVTGLRLWQLFVVAAAVLLLLRLRR